MRRKETKWFAHDCYDECEPAITAMCYHYKMEGYGRWWKLMEILRMEDDYKYNMIWPFSYKVLAIRLMTTETKVKQYIEDLINEYHLLQTDGVSIWSNWLIQRMQFLEENKKVMSE